MGASTMLCVILKIILLLRAEQTHGESLFDKDGGPYINVANPTNPPPVNLTGGDFTVSDCNTTTPSHQLRSAHIYIVIMFIIFIIFCCIMVAK